MKKLLLLASGLWISFSSLAQSEDPAGVSTLLTSTNLASMVVGTFPVTSCAVTVYNLGASTSAPTPAPGTSMSNDVWFQFVAPAQVVKIKVCSPTTFDAALEVWNQGATAMVANSNVGGTGVKEFVCATGLVYGNTYKIRVGRVSGTGAGSFTIAVEDMAIQVRNGYSPDPPGAPTCYNMSTNNLQRSLISFPVGQTMWIFTDESNNVFGPTTAPTISLVLNTVPGLCEGHTYQVQCQVAATDPDCGTIWWGYSYSKPVTVCSTVPITLINPACGSTITDVLNTPFQCSFAGDGYTYQFRFVTDNGNTDFCTPWQTSPIVSNNSTTYMDNFRYNKIYEVYVRTRYCTTGADPAWQGPCVIHTAPIPYQSPNIACCVWRNKSGTVCSSVSTNMDQYRFRFSEVHYCESGLQPIGPAITTGWSNSACASTGAFPFVLGSNYNVQVQCRIMESTITKCDGTTTLLPGQQSDWGPSCVVGIRALSGSPPVGSQIGCTCTAGMPMEFEMVEFPADITMPDVTEEFVGFITTTVTDGRMLSLDFTDSGLYGNGILRIYNMSGQLVASRNLYELEINNTARIETESNLPSGVYIVNVQTDTGQLSNKVFISND